MFFSVPSAELIIIHHLVKSDPSVSLWLSCKRDDPLLKKVALSCKLRVLQLRRNLESNGKTMPERSKVVFCVPLAMQE